MRNLYCGTAGSPDRISAYGRHHCLYTQIPVRIAGSDDGRCLVRAARRMVRYLYQVASGRHGGRCAGYHWMAGLPIGIAFNASLLFEEDNQWSLGPTILGDQVVSRRLCRSDGATTVRAQDRDGANVIRGG